MNNSIDETNPFKGKQRPEQTKAWNDIRRRKIDGSLYSDCRATQSDRVLGQIIAFSEDDLKAINCSSIEIPDGGGFIVTLDVFHEIQCL